MKTTKLYPFSISKHGHDIEFRYNRLQNIISDYFDGELELNDTQLNRIEEELELVTKAYHTILQTPNNGRVVWVDGSTLYTLKKCVAWAINERARKQQIG